MLLIQASKANSEPNQAYNVGILSKIVNSLTLIYRKAYMIRERAGRLSEDMKGLFVWILGSVTRVIQLTWKLKNHMFCIFGSLISRPFVSRVLTVFVRSFGSLPSFSFSICFLLRLVLPILFEIN